MQTFTPPPPLDEVRPSATDEQADMAYILSHLEPRTAEEVRMVAAALKTYGAKFEDAFFDWAEPFGRYKAKGLWVKTRPDPDALTEVINRQLAATTKANRFRALDREAITALPPPSELVKGVAPKQGLGVIFGRTGSGKGFTVEDMGCAIAEGRSWFGHRTKRTPVLHVVLEGASAIPARIRAWEAHNNRAFPDNFGILTQAFALNSEQDVRDLAAICPPGCVVFIDTLNRATPGLDENSGKDMGIIIAAASRLQELVGGLVILVSHTGKDAEKGLRGHSSLLAAMDFAISVNRTEVGRNIKIEKVKDGADGKEHEFRLEVVTVGKDEDGDEITSCVVVPQGAEYAAPGAVQLSPRMQHRFAMTTFLVLLHKYTLQGRVVVETKAHVEFAKHPESGGVTAEAFKTAKELLLAEDKIEVIDEPGASPSRARRVLREKVLP